VRTWTNSSPASNSRSPISTVSWGVRTWRTRKGHRAPSEPTSQRPLVLLRWPLPIALMGTAQTYITGIMSLGQCSSRVTSGSMVCPTPDPSPMVLRTARIVLVVFKTHPILTMFVLVRGSCPKSIFQCLVVRNYSCGTHIVRIISTMGWGRIYACWWCGGALASVSRASLEEC
jgi:hypothetical protein